MAAIPSWRGCRAMGDFRPMRIGFGVVVYQYTNSRRVPGIPQRQAMKTVRHNSSPSQPRDAAVERRGAAVDLANRRLAREFGTGYGKSSGYASKDRGYVPAWRQVAFRCA